MSQREQQINQMNAKFYIESTHKNKVAKKVRKRSQKEPKVAKRKPKGDQNASKSPSSQKVAKRMLQGPPHASIFWSILGVIFHPKSEK